MNTGRRERRPPAALGISRASGRWGRDGEKAPGAGPAGRLLWRPGCKGRRAGGEERASDPEEDPRPPPPRSTRPGPRKASVPGPEHPCSADPAGWPQVNVHVTATTWPCVIESTPTYDVIRAPSRHAAGMPAHVLAASRSPNPARRTPASGPLRRPLLLLVTSSTSLSGFSPFRSELRSHLCLPSPALESRSRCSSGRSVPCHDSSDVCHRVYLFTY